MVDLLSKSEYYPFGMEITGLSWNTGNNRYGFGGTHELDNELKGGVGNYLSFGDFGYDTKVARMFYLDTIEQIFISNYAGFGNNPIYFTDPSGYAKNNPNEIFSIAKGSEIGDQMEFEGSNFIWVNDKWSNLGVKGEVIATNDKTSTLENIGSFGIGVMESTLGAGMEATIKALTDNSYIPN